MNGNVGDRRHPAHAAALQRRLLGSSIALIADGRIDHKRLSDADLTELLSVAAQTVLTHLRAVGVHLHSIDDRHRAATDAFERAAAFDASSRAEIGAVATVVGGLADGELSAALAINRCRAAFSDDQLRGAAVCLVAACLVRQVAVRRRSSACAARAGAGASPVPWPRSA